MKNGNNMLCFLCYFLWFQPIYVCYPIFDSIKNWKMIVQIDYEWESTQWEFMFFVWKHTHLCDEIQWTKKWA